MEYTLRYLPIAKQDLSDAINFILNEYQIYGICLTENTASVRVLEKCGFTQIYKGMGNYQGKEAQIINLFSKIPSI